MTTIPCIILGGVISTIATMLLVEDEINYPNYPAAGSGARGRSAAKRSAEASGGASIFPPTQNRWNSPVESENGNVSGECVGGKSLSSGSPTSGRAGVVGSVCNGIEKCRKALARREVATGVTSLSNREGTRPPLESFTAGEQFAHDVQAALFVLLLEGIISEAEYNASAELLRIGSVAS